MKQISINDADDQEKWTAAVQACIESKLKVREWCLTNNVNHRTLYARFNAYREKGLFPEKLRLGDLKREYQLSHPIEVEEKAEKTLQKSTERERPKINIIMSVIYNGVTINIYNTANPDVIHNILSVFADPTLPRPCEEQN